MADFLEETIARRTAANHAFPELLEAARRRRELMRTLGERRVAQHRSQTAVAAAMKTSQSFVARLETAATDAKVSTIERYAETLGFVVQYHLLPADKQARRAPAVVIH